jgi:hypothetical protein
LSLTILPADTDQDDSLYLILSDEERRDLIYALDLADADMPDGGMKESFAALRLRLAMNEGRR